LKIDSSRVSKHNEGLVEPKGIKVKEKDVQGSRRPIGGLEKAKSKKKKKNNTENAQPLPHGASMV
jgi:zinc finger SWIM domain-containing protein 3